MIGNHITQEGTLHRYSRGSKNALGDYEARFTDVPVYVELQQQVAKEIRDNQNTAVSAWVAYFRPDTVLAAADELTVDGVRYSFDGDPWKVRHPRLGRTSHWVARLRRVK